MQLMISPVTLNRPIQLLKNGGSIELAPAQPTSLSAKIIWVVLRTRMEMDVFGTEMHPLTVETTMTKISLQALCVVPACNHRWRQSASMALAQILSVMAAIGTPTVQILAAPSTPQTLLPQNNAAPAKIQSRDLQACLG